MPQRTISLGFDKCVEEITRRRITYALRVFASVFGYEFVSDARADIHCLYSLLPIENYSGSIVHVPARYRPREKAEKPSKLERTECAGESIPLLFGLNDTGRPDWLGEIFEWISGSLESACEERDAVGRIPFSETVFEKHKLSPLKPFAGILMAWLQSEFEGYTRPKCLPKAPSPSSEFEHAVICSHDIDFHYAHSSSAWRRVGKNIVYSVVGYNSPSFFWSSVKMTGKLILGKPIGDYIPHMVNAIEAQGFRSTLFAVADGDHRRDPEYRLAEIAPHLRHAAAKGFGVALHASYESLGREWTLRNESRKLGSVVGHRPAGSRQHWLRFHAQDSLNRELQRSGLAYDSSIGFAEMCGFRNGANFAYPPYDFEAERAFDFLEIPLVIMDGSLPEASRTLRMKPQEIADRILEESRRLGWGGVSVLWHNPMEAVQVPENINRVFWKSSERNGKHGERWMSAEQFLHASLPRYQAAGLLREVCLDA